MPTAIPVLNQVFTRLTVTKELPPEVLGGRRRRYVECSCSCGTQHFRVVLESLQAGLTRSCGCLKRELSKVRFTTHGQGSSAERTPEYNAWKLIHQRCNNPKNPKYKDYGGRGIRVSAAWDTFAQFFKDMGKRPSARHSIDRFPDTNGNYEPGNCRWATPAEQTRNKRNNIWVEMRGRRMILKDWAKELGIDYKLAHARIRKGWDPMKALGILPP